MRYERAANRVSASKLHEIARALNVPISFFFDGYGEGEGAATTPTLSETEAHPDPLYTTETLRLIKAVNRLTEEQRKYLLALAETMGR